MTEEKACISVMEVSDHKILPLKNVPECWVEYHMKLPKWSNMDNFIQFNLKRNSFSRLLV